MIELREEQERRHRIERAGPDLLAALEGMMSWEMRDGTLCGCPAGKDEWKPKGKMPTVHSTTCQEARAAIAEARKGE